MSLQLYTVQGGDTWASIAAARLGNGTLAEALAGANGYGVSSVPPAGTTVYVAVDRALAGLRLGRLTSAPGTLRRAPIGVSAILIAEATLGVDSPSIDVDLTDALAQLPPGVADLKVIAVIASARAAVNNERLLLRLNGDAGAGRYQTLTYITQQAPGPTWAGIANPGAITNAIAIAEIPGRGTPALTSPAQLEMLIPRANGSDFRKRLYADWCRTGATDTADDMTPGLTWGQWADAAAINRLTFLPEVGPNLLAGSSVSVYAFGA